MPNASYTRRVRSTGRVLFAFGPVLGGALLTVGCFAVGEGVLPPLHRTVTDGGAPPLLFVDGSAGTTDASLPPLLPHSVVSVDPAYGPFTGGNRAIVRGTGFSSNVRVWVGNAEVPAGDIVPIDPEHVQITVPPGHAGPADVSAQDGTDSTTQATLARGYVYDPFYVDPSSGPVSGGTIITLHGDGTHWTLGTRVLVDANVCEVIAIREPAQSGAPQELDCKTPPGTPGAKSVRVVTEGGSEDVLDAFLYGDSNNGFQGGLSGGNLAGALRVIALSSSTNRALAGATVIIGGDVTSASAKTTDENGVVDLADPTLGKTVTVTVAAHCFMPTTFVDVPVDTVTAFLDPVLSPDCISKSGSITGVGTGGGSAQAGASVQGELVWPSRGELQRGPWAVPPIGVSVPDGSTDIRRVAYVFPLASTPRQTFRLPPKSQGVTEADVGGPGYKFKTTTGMGNLTLYALAGIEDRTVSPALFTAYSFGIVSGVDTETSSAVKDVYIQMNVPLDHAISLTVAGPTPTPRGPDRVEATVGIRVGTFGYVILPIGTQSSLLPATAPLSFVGLPPLVNGLAAAQYITTATAFTGESHSPPLSVIGLVATTAPAGPLQVDGFVQVPRLDVPGADGAWNGQDLATSAAPGPDVDLTLFEIQSGNGLSTWTVTLPRGATTARLPDLSAVPSLASPTGPVSITVSRAQISNFDYGALRYSQLTASGWTAYATDVFQAHN